MAEAELEPERVERVGRVVVDPLHVPESREELFGERWAVVGGMALVADDDHRPGMSLVADLLGRAEPGERRADDEDRGVRGEWLWHRRSS